MGGLCEGLVPQPPEINLDAAALTEAINGAVETLLTSVPENERKFRAEVDKCGDDGKFEVPDTTIVLTKASTDEDIRTAAVTSAFAGDARDQVKDTVWGAVEPSIDEQLEENAADVPAKLKNVAKDKFREATVDPAVDKALDEALEKAKKGDGAAPAAA